MSNDSENPERKFDRDFWIAMPIGTEKFYVGPFPTFDDAVAEIAKHPFPDLKILDHGRVVWPENDHTKYS